MLFSEEKLTHVAHLVYEGVGRHDGVQLLADEEVTLRLIKQVIFHEFRLDDEIDGIVRAKLASYSKQLVENSAEWEVLYKKHFEEELRKRRRG